LEPYPVHFPYRNIEAGVITMAKPDPQRQGSEKDQRRHVGNTSEASDLGIKDKSQGKAGTASPERKAEDPSHAPESGDKSKTSGQN
jgi:hypothetical protein